MATAPTTSERTPRGQGELLRERLIDAALEMIDEGDQAGISIRAVTKRAGVSPTAFYLHFENLELLMTACVERVFTVFRDRVRAVPEEITDPRGRLHMAGLGYIDFAQQWPQRYALIFGTTVGNLNAAGAGPTSGEEEEAAPEPSAAGDEAFDDLIGSVLACLPTGDPRREDAELLARGIWSGLHGYVTLSHCRPKGNWPSGEQFATRLAEAWLGEPGSERG